MSKLPYKHPGNDLDDLAARHRVGARVRCEHGAECGHDEPVAGARDLATRKPGHQSGSPRLSIMYPSTPVGTGPSAETATQAFLGGRFDEIIPRT